MVEEGGMRGVAAHHTEVEEVLPKGVALLEDVVVAAMTRAFEGAEEAQEVEALEASEVPPSLQKIHLHNFQHV